MNSVSELNKKPWYRFFKVIFIIVVLVVMGITGIFWYSIGSQKIYNSTDAYFICNNDTTYTHYAFNSDELRQLSETGFIFDTDRLVEYCSGNTERYGDINYVIGG